MIDERRKIVQHAERQKRCLTSPLQRNKGNLDFHWVPRSNLYTTESLKLHMQWLKNSSSVRSNGIRFKLCR